MLRSFVEQIGCRYTSEEPVLFYSSEVLDQTVEACRSAAEKNRLDVVYALKANHNPMIVKRMVKAGFGIDCVSGQEVSLALEMGCDPARVVFAGAGKKLSELLLALESGIGWLHVEGLEELDLISEIWKDSFTTRLAIRINPEVDAMTHAKITTGTSANKFGFTSVELVEFLGEPSRYGHLPIHGLHFHIGSQIRSSLPYVNAVRKANDWVQRFQEAGLEITYLNLGGGWGVNYDDPFSEETPNFIEWFETVRRHAEVGPEVLLRVEPGRSLVAQCGVMASRVLYRKPALPYPFVILSAGMSEILRPAMYSAHHHIMNISASRGKEQCTLVGPACESSDQFASGHEMDRCQRGDAVVLLTCGAYVESMKLNYNGKNELRTEWVTLHKEYDRVAV